MDYSQSVVADTTYNDNNNITINNSSSNIINDNYINSKHHNQANEWGLVALGAVVFDLDVGQVIEQIYPQDIHLSKETKHKISSLALPHTNKHIEGDTQFCFRYRISTELTLEQHNYSQQQYQYGFVLFRQRKDVSCTRGFFQKSLVLLTNTPLVCVYERIVRFLGPVFFKLGNKILKTVYETILKWYVLCFYMIL